MPESLFGSVSSTPTDVTSMWGDFPQDAQEAFADAQEDVDRKNYFLDRIIEETMVKVRIADLDTAIIQILGDSRN